MPMPSFFGGRRRAFPFDAMNPMMSQTEQKPDIPTGEVTARSGVRGLFTRKSLPNTLNVIGAGLRQMDGGNELDEYLAGQQDQQYQRDMFGMRTRAQKQEEGDAERTRQERLAAVGALPENLRPFGSLAVEPYLESLSRAPAARYGDLERIDGRLGQRNEATNQYDWAPQTGNYGDFRQASPQDVPQGVNPRDFQVGPNGRLYQVPGAAQRLRFEQGQRAAVQRSLQALDTAEDITDSIADARRLSSGMSTGFVGGMTREVPGTPAYNLSRAVNTIKANLGFEALQAMRDSSPTGGALGQVAVQELEMLQSIVDSFDTAQSEGEFNRALDRADRYIARRQERSRRLIEAYEMDLEASGGAEQQQAPSGRQAPRIIDLEPE
jgi:hypothetical protein